MQVTGKFNFIKQLSDKASEEAVKALQDQKLHRGYCKDAFEKLEALVRTCKVGGGV